MSSTKRCLLLCKGKNFKANHNKICSCSDRLPDVCYYAKVRILKQITTRLNLGKPIYRMFVIMQR